jgi:hypothetical protein
MAEQDEPALYLLDTLEHPNLINVDASETRSTMLLHAGNGCLSLGLDLAQTVQANNSVEKWLSTGWPLATLRRCGLPGDSKTA